MEIQKYTQGNKWLATKSATCEEKGENSTRNHIPSVSAMEIRQTHGTTFPVYQQWRYAKLMAIVSLVQCSAWACDMRHCRICGNNVSLILAQMRHLSHCVFSPGRTLLVYKQRKGWAAPKPLPATIGYYFVSVTARSYGNSGSYGIKSK